MRGRSKTTLALAGAVALAVAGLAIPTSASGATAIPWSPSFSSYPVGEAPCAEGQSRSATLYRQGYETSIPWAQFNDGFVRYSSTSTEGSWSAGSALSGTAGTDEHMFLPYVAGTSGRSTQLAYSFRGNAAVDRVRVGVNSQSFSPSMSSTWTGHNHSITTATRDAGGQLGTWFEHYATSGTSTTVYIDNVQIFTCRTNATTRLDAATHEELAAQAASTMNYGTDIALAYVVSGR